jgi:hypothetical protein
MIASADLQRAIYVALNGVVSGGVYNAVPAGAAAPYVVIGETTEAPWDTMTDEGSQETITLHLWSKYDGHLEVNNLMAEVDDVLHNAILSLTGATMVNMQREFKGTFSEQDGGVLWMRGEMRFRVWISQ